jgi:hypothetical protein
LVNDTFTAAFSSAQDAATFAAELNKPGVMPSESAEISPG